MTRSRADCCRSPWIVSTPSILVRPAGVWIFSVPRLVRQKMIACRGFSRSISLHQQIELLLGIDGEVELLDRLDRHVLGREIQRLPARACSARPAA